MPYIGQRGRESISSRSARASFDRVLGETNSKSIEVSGNLCETLIAMVRHLPKSHCEFSRLRSKVPETNLRILPSLYSGGLQFPLKLVRDDLNSFATGIEPISR